MPDLMQWEQDLIINSMLRKSSKNIATLLSINEKTVADFIRLQPGMSLSITMDKKIADRKAHQVKTIAIKKAKLKKEKTITSARVVHSVTKFTERHYKTIKQDYSELIPVKIDHKTYIYVKPGSDIDKVKRQFLKDTNNTIKEKITKSI